MPFRVVQWTTGKTGTAAVRGMVGHPELDLVGCYAYSADKVGQDVGVLCGLEPIGVIATDDIDALLALKPDCVSYMPYRPDFDHVVRILESGVNVVTTMYRLAGTGYGDDVLERIEDAAQRGQSSLYASGIYPGHAPMVGLAASAMCTDRSHLGARVARHPRLSERDDVPRHGLRSGDRRPGGGGAVRVLVRFVR